MATATSEIGEWPRTTFSKAQRTVRSWSASRCGYPTFATTATRLQEALNGELIRRLELVERKPALVQTAVFALGHQAADDFSDIVLLAVHGYGMGAVKLLRPFAGPCH